MDTDSVNKRILKDLENYIARCVECDFLPLIPDGTMYEINQYSWICRFKYRFNKKGLKYGWYYYSHIKGYISFLSFNDNEGNSKKLKIKIKGE